MTIEAGSASATELESMTAPIDKIAGALAKAQSAMRNAPKQSLNPHFKSSYADLASVLDACRGPLSENGIALVQLPSVTAAGVRVETLLIHSSGQQLTGALDIPLLPPNRTAQNIGSAISYGRRYLLMAMTGIAGDDDDGNGTNATIPPLSEQVAATAPNGNGGKRTSEIKERLRQRAPEVAAAAEAQGTPDTPWLRILGLGRKYGIEQQALNAIVKRITGKSRPAEIGDDDVSLVHGALQAETAMPPSKGA